MVRNRIDIGRTDKANLSSLTFAKVERTTVSAQIISQIKERILSGGFSDGDQLPSERVLAEAFQVSRPAVREALKALEYIGLIETRPGEGVFVRGDMEVLNSHLRFARLLRRYSLEEMVETRRVVEVATVRFAIERASDEDLELLNSLHRTSLDLIEEPQAFLDADFRFHQAIAEMAGNSILLEVLNAMREMTVDMNHEVLRRPGQSRNATGFHTDILAAMLARDPDRAQAVMNDHLDNLLEALSEVFDGDFSNNT